MNDATNSLSIIVAVDQTGGFGKLGNIPWKDEPFAKEDFKHFQLTTKDSVCIMGRKTYEEILDMAIKRTPKDQIESILPGRVCYVISSNQDLEVIGAKVVPNLRAAMQDSNELNKNTFVLGGEKLFIEALAWTNTIYMTIVKDWYNCDKFFPMSYVDTAFAIDSGTQTDKLYFLTYKRK